VLHVAVLMNDIGIAQRCQKTAKKEERASGIFAISGKIMRRVLWEACIVEQGMQLLDCSCGVYSIKDRPGEGLRGFPRRDRVRWMELGPFEVNPSV
jgi:hypothetical protein